MLFHHIPVYDVRPGDHLYRWRNLKLLQGIAVQHEDNIFVIMSNGFNTLCSVTLSAFKGKGILRRALYDQGDSYLHWIKLPGTSFIDKRRPPEEIVQNAFLLLDIGNRYPERIQELFVNGFGDFARLCCTHSNEYWRNKLLENGYNAPPANNVEQIAHIISNTSINEQKMKELENKIEILEDRQSCPICMEQPNSIAFSCGHLACYTCAQSLKICHTCRQDIHQKFPLYWP